VLDLRTYEGAPSDESEGGRWLTICDAPGANVNQARRALAVAWAGEPSMWCDGCRT
jgi:hypothetical protein